MDIYQRFVSQLTIVCGEGFLVEMVYTHINNNDASSSRKAALFSNAEEQTHTCHVLASSYILKNVTLEVHISWALQ